MPKIISSKKYYRHTPQRLTSVLMLFTLIIGMSIGSLVAANATNGSLECPEASTIPILDGILSPGEWDDAQRYDFFVVPDPPHPADDITIFLKHNTTHLFFAYDVRPDNTTEDWDAAFVFFDLDNNGTKDIEIGEQRDGSDDCRHYFGSSSEWIDDQHYIMAWGFNTTAQEPVRNHTIVEIMISIDLSTEYTGQSLLGTSQLPFKGSPVGVVFGGYGTLQPEWFFGNTTPIVEGDIWGPSAQIATFYSDLYLTYKSMDPLLILLIIMFPAIGVAIGVFIYYRRREVM